MRTIPTLATLLLLCASACAQLPAIPKNPVEYGRIAWQRHLDEALGGTKPVFVLFQEVPG